jgi:hypothetical protein
MQVFSRLASFFPPLEASLSKMHVRARSIVLSTDPRQFATEAQDRMLSAAQSFVAHVHAAKPITKLLHNRLTTVIAEASPKQFSTAS